MSDYAPVSFTTFGGAGNFLSRRRVVPLLKQALTDEQCAVLLAAYDKRLEAIRSDIPTFAIYLIDEELFLATGQCEPLTEKLQASWLQETGDLPPQLARHLTIAGKGSAMQSAAAWRKSAAGHYAVPDPRQRHRRATDTTAAIDVAGTSGTV